MIADAAYPKQSNPAIKTININATQLEAVELVNRLIDKAGHVDANVFIDEELAFVSEADSKAIGFYRTRLMQLLDGKSINVKLHEDIIRELDNSAALFNVLILKTNFAVPYSSVFFQLECGYWNGKAEKELRNKMSSNE